MDHILQLEPTLQRFSLSMSELSRGDLYHEHTRSAAFAQVKV